MVDWCGLALSRPRLVRPQPNAEIDFDAPLPDPLAIGSVRAARTVAAFRVTGDRGHLLDQQASVYNRACPRL
jgi:hypothetical protein